MTKRVYILFLFLLCFQLKAQNQDSISKPETFNSIEKYSKKNNFFQSIHKLIFKNKNKHKTPAKEVKKIDPINYQSFQGKIIRNVNIETMDPFGFSVSDSTKKPVKGIEKLGNKAHLKTKKFTVRNILLFKPDQKFDSIKIKETERLIRSQRFVRSVSITPIIDPNNKDSVDIDIKVLDSWSIFPTGTLSNNGGQIKLISRNFGGFGHYFSNQYKTRFTDNKHAFQSQYQVNNIANTFVNIGALYDIDLEKNYQKSIYIERPFYSPLAKYAGGISFTNRFYKDSIRDLINGNANINIKFNSYDAWVGRAFRISDLSEKNITNFITSVRYNIVNYVEKPIKIYDPHGLYSNQHLLLGSLKIASSSYRQTKYLFNYGIIEDVNEGKSISITGGLQWKNQIARPYFGAEYSIGKFLNENYLGATVEWGTYFNGNNLEQSVLKIEGLAFSKIYEHRNWKFRQFFNAELVYGYNRLDYVKDRISLNGKTTGIDGFNSYSLIGTKRVLISLQTQSYAPGDWLGFRFSPFLSASLGWLGNENDKFVNSNMYSKIAFGILINNDYLVFQNIQFSIALYPSIPGYGKNIIKTNNIRNDNFNLMRFNTGRPTTISYQ